MEVKIKNREWVKSAAIVFLSVLLVLTFFSNTIMNRTLPEVATANVTSGSITAKVRGSGKVTAVGTYEVKLKQTRTIRSVMVKVGQEVKTGDVLFVLGEGESTELENAERELRNLEMSLKRAMINTNSTNYTSYLASIDRAERTLASAQTKMDDAYKKWQATISDTGNTDIDRLKETIADLDSQVKALQDGTDSTYYDGINRIKAPVSEFTMKFMDNPAKPYSGPRGQVYEELCWDLDYLIQMQGTLVASSSGSDAESADVSPATETPDYNAQIMAYQQKIIEVKWDLPMIDGVVYSNEYEFGNKMNERLETIKSERDYLEVQLVQLQSSSGTGNPTYYQDYLAAQQAYYDAVSSADIAYSALYDAQAADGKTAALNNLEIQSINMQIADQRDKIAKLSGDSDNQVLANANGTVSSISCTAGQSVVPDTVLCTIEVSDMGYNLSFAVTSDQAQRLRIGDTATISNYYWGKEITATLTSIRNDPKNPQGSKILTFDLDGEVTSGSDLTISVGSKSAPYDIIIPNSAIRTDSNGSFVLAVTAKSSPLGNRYTAKRVSIDVIASDDENSAVTGGLNNGDYVITTSNAPIVSGDMVRMADSNE